MRKRDVVDHSLQRRAVLHDMRTGGPFGTTTADDVCDASPYLKSAARALGEETARSCPVCHRERLWEVSWVYGDAIGDASGSARTQAQVGELAASRPDFAGYDVEVCLECGWNHLVRSWRAGTAGMPPARRSRQARTGM
ncbi:MAG TPA: DUF5318 family protein [Mycobacteriales bacterium]|nr:DUF5318 family protein [Mycobacteriales bacterium]